MNCPELPTPALHLEKVSAMKLYKTKGSHISTLSTFTPHGSVASSRTLCMVWAMDSLSAEEFKSEEITTIERQIDSLPSIWDKFLVPRTFLSVVAANNRVEWLKKRQQ